MLKVRKRFLTWRVGSLSLEWLYQPLGASSRPKWVNVGESPLQAAGQMESSMFYLPFFPLGLAHGKRGN